MKLITLLMIGQKKPWYLSGGVAKSNCIASYKPKGAVNLANSYINLANPGTYNAAPGPVGGAPTWNATDGWIFDGATQTLTTGIVLAAGANATTTMIVRFTAAAAYIVGIHDGTGGRYVVSPTVGVTFRQYVSGTGTNSVAGGNITAGIMALAGGNCYLNGATDGTLVPSAVDPAGHPIIIGGDTWSYDACKIQAFAVYNIILTAAQIATVSASMAVL